jgi:hypothetical protein
MVSHDPCIFSGWPVSRHLRCYAHFRRRTEAHMDAAVVSDKGHVPLQPIWHDQRIVVFQPE